MKIKDCYKEVTHEADLVKESDSIETVMDSMAKDPLSRSVYVIDNEEKLIGAISVRDVLEFLGAQFIDNPYGTVREIFAKNARDIMRMPVSVSIEDSIEKAIKTAIHEGLDDIPVCDGEGKVMGDLNCFEIINNIRKGD